MNTVNLRPGKNRRALRDIKELVSPADVWDLVVFPIKDSTTKALCSFLLVVGCRIGEALMLKRSQVEEDYKPKFALVKNLESNKLSLRHLKLAYRPQVLLPLEGVMAPFSKCFLGYVSSLPHGQEVVFPFSRWKAWHDIKEETGLFPHWFRSMSENYWSDVFGDTIKAGQYLNVDPRSLTPYIKVDLESFEGRMLK